MKPPEDRSSFTANAARFADSALAKCSELAEKLVSISELLAGVVDTFSFCEAKIGE